MSLISAPRDNPRGEWEKFKGVLQDLYMTQDLPLQDVMDLMKSRHGFERSKSRYTAQFKKWKFEKYSKSVDSEHFKAVSLKVHRAKKCGKETRVYHKGKQVTSKMLRTRGYLQGSDYHSLERAMSPATPPEFTFEASSPFASSGVQFPFDNLWNTLKSLDSFSRSLEVDDLKSTIICSQDSASLSRLGTLLTSCYFPSTANDLTSPTFEGGIQQANTEHWFRFILYALSNDHSLSIGYEGKLALLRALENFNALRLLNRLSNEPSSQALVEGIFRLAVESQNLNTVRRLLRNGLNPNGHGCRDPKGYFGDQLLNPLQFALLAGNLALAELLIQHNATLDEPGGGWKSSAIVLAIGGWHVKLNPRVQDQCQGVWRQRQEHIDEITKFVKFLIQKGAAVGIDHSVIDLEDFCYPDENSLDISLPMTYERHSPLTIASRYHMQELFKIFLSPEVVRNASITGEIDHALHAAIIGDRELGGLWRWSDKQTQSTTAEREIDGYNEYQDILRGIISRLVQAGADVNMTLLHYEDIENIEDHNKVQEHIEDHNKMQEHCPLELAADRSCDNHGFTVHGQLLDLGAKPTVRAFRKNFYSKNHSACFRLISIEPYTICQEEEFYDALWEAHGRMSTIDWLIQGIDKIHDEEVQLSVVLRLLNLHNLSPEWYGTSTAEALFASCQCIPRLVSRHKNVFLKSKNLIPVLGRMSPERLVGLWGEIPEVPIHSAIVGRNTSLAKQLIRAGRNIDEVVDYRGMPETALCAAVRQQDQDLVKMLIKWGARELWLFQCGGLVHQANPLIPAIENGDLELARYLISRGADLNTYGLSEYSDELQNWMDVCDKCEYITPLTAYLLYQHNLEFLQFLIRKGAQVNELTVDGRKHHLSPLGAIFVRSGFSASEIRFRGIVAQVLLDSGANPLDMDALFFAGKIYQEDPSLLHQLLQKVLLLPPEASRPSLAGNMALIQAIRVMQPDLVNALLAKGVVPIPVEDMPPRIDSTVSSKGVSPYLSPLYVAVMDRADLLIYSPPAFARHEIICSLLQAGYGPHPQHLVLNETSLPRPILPQALELSDDDEGVVLKLLLDEGFQNPPLAEVATRMQFQTNMWLLWSFTKVRMLFDHGIKPLNVPTTTKLCWEQKYTTTCVLQDAAVVGCLEVVEYLILQGEDVNAVGNDREGATALQFALIMKHFDIAKLLIERGADVNAPPSSLNGFTCLLIVVLWNDLKSGTIDTDQSGKFGLRRSGTVTAFEPVLEIGSLDFAKYLIEHDADVNAPIYSRKKSTLLQIFARRGNLEWVKFLVRHGADVNASSDPDTGGPATALHHAVENRSLDVMRYLVEHGADVNALAISNGGLTALQRAAKHGFVPIAEYLIRHEADVNAPGAEHDGGTALEFAAENGRLDMVQLLLHSGAGRGEDHGESVKKACQKAQARGFLAIRNLIQSTFDT